MPVELSGYRITRQIGIGAASKIYLAHHMASGRRYALKHVVRNSAEDDRFLEQVETEYAVSRKVDHPQLRKSISLHRVRKGFRTRELLLVMEYVDGLTLDVARPNRLNTFFIIFTKVAAGLQALHEAGYVHSDIKPINIILGAKGVVKIIDFGQSCKIHHKKLRIQGTPDYIAPEQVRRMPLDPRTDVFNLGATMYWVLLSENYPTAIRGLDASGKISLINPDKPIAPIELNDKIPLALSQLVMECCRDNPADRPADMMQLASRLSVIRKRWKDYRNDLRKEQRSSGNGGPPAQPQPAKEEE